MTDSRLAGRTDASLAGVSEGATPCSLKRVHWNVEQWQMTAMLLELIADSQPRHSLVWYIGATAALAAAAADAAAA
jgi:hypothetical protein